MFTPESTDSLTGRGRGTGRSTSVPFNAGSKYALEVICVCSLQLARGCTLAGIHHGTKGRLEGSGRGIEGARECGQQV